ncbi:peptidoglycan bridge formation glycyltransferase FemA/FemB family protein, partial [Candidatus Woesebacteria bacterium]|nr:peptidoglycan bridge formation glycyltransferase FemA/FemB family protein [Candidatus Woesebacteria bacterium]
MNYTILTDSFDQEEFNRVANHPLQSWQWGEARKETGQEILRIGAFENTDLKHVYTITLHQIPKTSYRIGYCGRSIMPSTELIEFLKGVGKKEKLIFIKFEPDELKNTHLTTNYLPAGRQGQLPTTLRISPTPLFPSWTQVLDLTQSEEELFKGLKSKTRYNIRYAEKNNVVVYEDSSEAGFKTFSQLYFQTVDRQTYHGHNEAYHSIIWN